MYLTDMTLSEVKEDVKKDFVDFAGPVTESDGFQHAIPSTANATNPAVSVLEPHRVTKRAAPPGLRQRSDSAHHLKFISEFRYALDENVFRPFRPREDYTYDPTLGHGSTIYVVDSGFQQPSAVSQVSITYKGQFLLTNHRISLMQLGLV